MNKPVDPKTITSSEIFQKTLTKKPLPKPKARPADDPWADWAPVWSATAKTASPHDQQEKHSPTRTTAGVSTTDRARQRRIVDARLWDAMTAMQQEAAIQIALSCEVMSRGLGYVSSDWQRIPGCRGRSDLADAHSRMINTYIDWTTRCQKSRIAPALILDILVFGLSCRAVDKARRMRAGSARDILFQGLNIYCRLKGW